MPNTCCRKCGKPIDFIKTASGKYMPVEPSIVHVYNNPDGNMTVITKTGKVIRAISAHSTDSLAMVAYIPHWQRCAGAEEVRKEQKAATVKREQTPAWKTPERPEPVDEQIKLF